MPLSSIRNKARSINKHNSPSIILPEGNDPRIVQAALIIANQNIAKPILIGHRATIDAHAENSIEDDLKQIQIIDELTLSKTDNFPALCQTLSSIYQKKGKDITSEQIHAMVTEPLTYATLMLANNQVNGCVAGVNNTTAKVLKAAFALLGTKPSIKTISGAFLMSVNDQQMVFADCAVVVDPSVEQLVDIAKASADSAQSLLGLEPKVAMLSFSTLGSGKHPISEKVANATALIKEKYPELAVEGEIQLDVAIDETVANIKKVKGKVAGQANVLIFPDLNAGNIGYKLVQRLAKGQAIGPILQGIAKPMNDLSRGASVDDIVDMVAVTAINAAS